MHNFDVVRYEFYRDRDVAFEGFTGRNYLFREEFTSRIWATRYNFPAIKDGRVKQDVLPDDTPSGAQGWFFNTRREKFKNRMLREALILAFDFEWTNKSIMYGSYDRTHSVFQNSNMMAVGRPGADELALLEPFRGKVPEEVFGEPFVPPVTDGSGQDRNLLRQASAILQKAGFPIKDGRRVMPNGERIAIEFLIDEPSFQPHHMPYIKNLGTLGIDASLRIVDPAQYRKRVDEFDFDITVQRFSFSTHAGRFVADLLHVAGGGDAGLAESRRHRRSGDRRAGRQDHRGRKPAGAGDRLQGARSRDPRRPLLGSALVQGVALDRLLGRLRAAADQAALCARHPGNLVVRPRPGGEDRSGTWMNRRSYSHVACRRPRANLFKVAAEPEPMTKTPQDRSNDGLHHPAPPADHPDHFRDDAGDVRDRAIRAGRADRARARGVVGRRHRRGFARSRRRAGRRFRRSRDTDRRRRLTAVRPKYRGAQGLDPKFIESLERQFGFDKPAHERFFLMLWNYLRFDFGRSYFRDVTVLELIKEKLPVSISLGIWLTLLSYLISIPLGIRKAVNDGSPFDVWTSGAIIVAYALPGFLVAVLLIVLFAGGSFFAWFPLRGLTSENFAFMPWWQQILDYLWHMVLPIISLGLAAFATMTLLTKNSFLDEIRKQYVLTARAKGCSERQVLYGHVFRNAMLIVIAGFPGAFVHAFFTGALLIEVIFSLDGSGLLGFESIINRDYPVVFATLYIFGLLGMVVTLISDLTYTWVDPRIDFESREV